MDPMARLRFALLVAIVLVAGHDVTYGIANGIGGMVAALRNTGHDGYWAPTIALVAAFAVTVAAANLLRRGRLLAELGALGARRHAVGLGDLFAAPTFFLATRVAAVALLVFVVQENIEHYTAHGGHLPGLGVLGAHGYGSTLPVFAALAAIVAIIARYLAAETAALVAAIARARSLPRSQRRVVALRPDWVNLPRAVAVSGRPDLGRAPPLLLGS